MCICHRQILYANRYVCQTQFVCFNVVIIIIILFLSSSLKLYLHPEMRNRANNNNNNNNENEISEKLSLLLLFNLYPVYWMLNTIPAGIQYSYKHSWCMYRFVVMAHETWHTKTNTANENMPTFSSRNTCVPNFIEKGICYIATSATQNQKCCCLMEFSANWGV